MIWEKGKFHFRQGRNENRPDKLLVGVTIGSSAYSFLRGQLNWLSKQGWEPILVSTPDRRAEAAAEREKVQLCGIDMERGISPLKDLVAILKWVCLIQTQRPKAISIGTPKASFLGIIAAFISRVPKRLYIVRGLRLEGASKPLSWVLWLMEWLTMALATDVFFVSESLARECKRRSLYFPKKSWLIGLGSSNGVNSLEIKELVDKTNREELRTSLGIHEDDFIVGFIGRLNKDKGVEQIFEALKSSEINSKVKVLALGDIEDETLLPELDNLRDKLIMTGWKDDAWAYFPAMEVLCLPTKREGFPNVVLEAASAGIPAITTYATGAIDSVVHDETGLLFQYGESEELVKYINSLVDDANKLANLGKFAQERVVRDFVPERIWVGINEILRDDESRIESRRFE